MSHGLLRVGPLCSLDILIGWNVGTPRSLTVPLRCFELQYTARQESELGNSSHHLPRYPNAMAVKPQRADRGHHDLPVSVLQLWLVRDQTGHDHGDTEQVMTIREAVFHARIFQVLVGVEYI